MKRKIIQIDEQKCNGCGLCIPNCPEGALQIIDGKARLVSDLFCDGLGECIGHCPEGAIEIVEREAEPYDERKVMENIIKAGPNTIEAHLKHLYDHDQIEFYNIACEFLKEKGLPIPNVTESTPGCAPMGCPGQKMQRIEEKKQNSQQAVEISSALRQWPIQLHLLNPQAPYLDNADLLIAADCTSYAYANFHQRFMKDKITIIFCPKLDRDLEVYIDKLAQIFAGKNIQSVEIVRMEVPCCGGVEMIVKKAMEKAGKIIFTKVNTISIDGNIL